MKITLLKYINNRKIYIFLAGIIIFIFIFLFFEHIPDLPLAILMIYWMVISIIYKIKENIFFIIALIFLVICPFFIIGRNQVMADKMAVWSFISIITGLIIWLASNIFKKTN